MTDTEKTLAADVLAELGVTFPATFQQWEGMQVGPATGEIMGEVLCQ